MKMVKPIMSDNYLTVKVLFFASLKDKVGIKQLEVNLLENACVSDLREQLARQFPNESVVIKECPVAVNRTFAIDQDVIPSGAEVAFIPRVSGG
jgi:molybdopterin converting factor subunit 1